MRESTTSRVECIIQGVVQQVDDVRHVDVSKTIQSAGEVGGVVKRPKDASKLLVEDMLTGQSEIDSVGCCYKTVHFLHNTYNKHRWLGIH